MADFQEEVGVDEANFDIMVGLIEKAANYPEHADEWLDLATAALRGGFKEANDG